MNLFTLPAPESVAPNAKMGFALFDSPSALASAASSLKGHGSGPWYSGHTYTEALSYARSGDLAGVPASDALLAKMEELSLPTSRQVWLDDVAGAIPNVQAYLAGSPCSMRRRVRQEAETAPIAVLVDLTTSAALRAEQTRARGVAILALVRALSAVRPVELWVLTGLDAWRDSACFIGCRIPTAPLDLATAAHCLTHIGFPRHLCYNLARKHFDFRGRWPFCLGALSREAMEQCLAPAFSHVTETLCLPGIHAEDPAVLDPASWLRRELATHSPRRLEDA